MRFWIVCIVCALQKVLSETPLIPHLRVYPDGCRHMRAIGKKQCLPAVIVNGQLKAGTTSLFDILEEHPEIMVQKDVFDKSVKEVNSFWFREAANNTRMYLRRLRQFPLQPINDTRITLEASPFYFSTMVDLKEDLSNFKKVQPNVKIVTILRNPVERSFSEFLMLSDHWDYASKCNTTSYEDIVLEELRIRNKSLLTNESLHHRCLTSSPMFYYQDRFRLPESDYVGRLVRWSEYSYFLKEWMKVFNETQMLILKVEDLKNKPAETVAKLLTWIGIKQVDIPVAHHNKAACRFKNRGDCEEESLHTDVNTQTSFSQEVGDILREHFKPYNDELARLTGLDVSDWNSGFQRPR
jgi:hypothetical protein